MKTFKEYITEAVSKNTHLEHLEDEIFNGGIGGARRALDFLKGLKNMLSGSSKGSVNVSVKWDGAPAIICGINPENKKFFVATKSAFNKNPKLNYTHKDIEQNHAGKGELINKLKLALDSLSDVGIKGILQGDLLFTRGDLKKATHNGERLITFKPNTITYAVPQDSELGIKIQAADLGIVFHTTYTGKKIADLKVSYGANVDSLKSTSKVWITDASFKNESGSATLTKDETVYVTDRIAEVARLLKQMNASAINQIVAEQQVISFVKLYVNSNVKTGQNIEGTKKYATGLTKFIQDKFKVEIDKLKTDKGKLGKKQKLSELVDFIKNNQEQLILMFMLAALIADIKGVLLKKLRQVNSIGTFLETPDGFKVTSPEGFVAVDTIGNAVKLVDRLEFSRANFTQEKDW